MKYLTRQDFHACLQSYRTGLDWIAKEASDLEEGIRQAKANNNPGTEFLKLEKRLMLILGAVQPMTILLDEAAEYL